MKTLLILCAVCASCLLASSAAGQTIVLRDTVLSFQSPAPVIPDRAERELERVFSRPRDTRDRIMVSLLSVSNALGADGITRNGVYWRADKDGGFRMKDKFSYRYNPRIFPHDAFQLLDHAFGTPIRFVTTKTFSF